MGTPRLKVYLATRYARHPEMVQIASLLRDEFGIETTCRWIHGSHAIGDEGVGDTDRERLAVEDFHDLLAADWVVSFTEEPGLVTDRPSLGGRHVEFGLGIGFNKRMIIVGPRENVFHWLPNIDVYDDLPAFLEHLREEKSNGRF